MMKKKGQMLITTKDQFSDLFSRQDTTWYYLEPKQPDKP